MKKETLNKFSNKIYSQFGEDGILREILKRIDKKDHEIYLFKQKVQSYTNNWFNSY